MRVARAANQPEAELIAGLLLEAGVPSLSRRAGGFDVPDFLAAGPRDVLVPAGGADVAREVLGERGRRPRRGSAARGAPGSGCSRSSWRSSSARPCSWRFSRRSWGRPRAADADCRLTTDYPKQLDNRRSDRRGPPPRQQPGGRGQRPRTEDDPDRGDRVPALVQPERDQRPSETREGRDRDRLDQLQRGGDAALLARRRLGQDQRADRGVADPDPGAGERSSRRSGRRPEAARRSARPPVTAMPGEQHRQADASARPRRPAPPSRRSNAGLAEGAEAPAQRRRADRRARPAATVKPAQLGQRERHERVAAEEGDREQPAHEDPGRQAARRAQRARREQGAAGRGRRQARAPPRRADDAERLRSSSAASSTRQPGGEQQRALRSRDGAAAPRRPERAPRSPRRVSTTATGRKGSRTTNTQPPGRVLGDQAREPPARPATAAPRPTTSARASARTSPVG